MEGWIQLHRKLTEWEWYKDVNTFKVFMHLILCANHKDANWRGQKIKRGQLIRSLNSLSHETGLSIKQIRTAINKLKKTGEVASEGTSKNTVFTVLGYDLYQSQESRGKQKGKQGASEGQTKGKQGATDNNDNNDDTGNNEEEDIKDPSDKPTENDPLLDEFEKFWDYYDKKKDREKSFKKWKRLTKKQKDEIRKHLPAYLKSTPDKQFRKNPLTYLNGECWNDEITERTQTPIAPLVAQTPRVNIKDLNL